MECADVAKAHDGVTVIRGFDAIVNRGERIVLVGRNGLGKTTLLQGAARRRARPAGREAGHRRRHGALGPRSVDRLLRRRITPARSSTGLTAVEWLHRFDPDASRQDIHGLLGQMLFSGEEGLKPTAALSGGETARLLFCRIMLQKPNVLVLDEPTNHLDLEAINALSLALQKFEGTVFLVTHDEDLMDAVGDAGVALRRRAACTTSRAATKSSPPRPRSRPQQAVPEPGTASSLRPRKISIQSSRPTGGGSARHRRGEPPSRTSD